MQRTLLFSAMLLALSSLSTSARAAEMPGMDMSQPGAMQPKADQSPSSKAFNDANMKMHKAMEITYSGNPDMDFVKSMIPHHAGAIDMARVELAYGKDPTLRKLAQAIIRAQQDEIAMMNRWLAARSK